MSLPAYFQDVYKIVYHTTLDSICDGLDKQQSMARTIDDLQKHGFNSNEHIFIAGEILAMLLDNPTFEIAVKMRAISKQVNN